ncbi:zinc finger protein 568-like [Calliphora vicina]|uniref:zinc finger protein 568-like n=1 Tax=Calliphora vicina TaxID=7373 RepID=UPI00325ACB12
MGASKKSDLQKCGELLIEIKKIKYKTKSYIFQCGFCSADCDQLKKFTKHLEDQHFHNFEVEIKVDPEIMEDERSNLSFDPEEIKVDQRMDVIERTDNDTTIANNSIGPDTHYDPLKTEKKTNDTLISNCLIVSNDPLTTKEADSKLNETHDLEANVNSTCEDDESDNDYVMSCDDSGNEIEHEYNTNCSDNTDEDEETPKKIKKKLNIVQKSYTSDVSTDDSRDSDFDIEKELNRYKKPKKPKKECKKDAKKQKELAEQNQNPSPKRIFKQILPNLIEQYKKHEILWKVENIGFGVKPMRLEILVKIAEEISLRLKKNITVEGIHNHLKYLNRLYSKDKKQELICKKENKEFIAESELYTEMSFLSESQGPYLCLICNEIIPRYDPYCQHMAQHNGTQPFKCTSCEMTFAKFDKYVIHKKRHLGVYNFYCNVCGKGYPFQAELDWHLSSHTGLKPYLCSICGERFRGRSTHADHMLRHQNRFRHECYICNKGFMHLHGLNSHIKCHLNIRDVRCKICDTGFTHSKYLKRHEKKYHPNISYNCDGCGEMFSLAVALCDHRKICHSLATNVTNET